jgi:hypothetical protein
MTKIVSERSARVISPQCRRKDTSCNDDGVGAAVGAAAITDWILLIAMNQKHTYMDLLSHLLPRLQPAARRRASISLEAAVSVTNRKVGAVS